MNLADYPTPETRDALAKCSPSTFDVTVNDLATMYELARSLEQRLSACRSALSAIKNVEAVRPEIHDEITRILTETSPKK